MCPECGGKLFQIEEGHYVFVKCSQCEYRSDKKYRAACLIFN